MRPMLPRKSNKRRYQRVLLPYDYHIRCKGKDFRGRVRVLGEGGMFVDTLHPSPDGTEMEVIIEAGQEPIRTRCVSRDHEPGCGMGVEFIELPEMERDRIRELISRFI